MTIQELKELALHSAKGTAPETFSVENVNEALADGLRAMCGSVNQFMKNRYDIYDIVITAADEIVPNKVIDALGIFAEVQQVAQGQKALFKVKKGRNRAKKFLTQVGLSGVYETFRLDVDTIEVSAHAVGGAATIDFERMLDGAEIMSELIGIISDAMVDSVYQEVQKCLKAALSEVPSVNRVSNAGWDKDKMLKLISIARAYGTGAVIFAPQEFVAAMGADDIVPISANNYPGVYHPQDIDAIHNQGYINIFRGTPIVMLPQSFVDENNAETVIDPQMAYVFPTGGERIVKVVLEGNTQMYDFVNRDQSMEINTYRKLGVAILTFNNWCSYQNSSIPQTMADMYNI